MSSGDPIQPSEPTRWSVDELIPFGKYILLNKISSGATAAVYRAKVRGEAGFERLLTIKRILPQMAGDPEFVDTFVREAKVCARLNHGNICPIYELGKVGESLYMAMEWVSGKDLGAISRRLEYTGKVMPPLIAAWIAGRMCDALDYAHGLKDELGEQLGIVHQDLSPANIVISYEGQVKLIDFGLAKAAGRAQQTNVDALKQKIGYMSPELILGTTLDGRSDVFGVGVCLYEMVTGRRLFAGQNDIATLKLVSTATVPPPSALVEDTPDDLEVIMMRALERDPDERWQSAGEMGQALTACIAGNDPTFGTRHVAEFMRELFAQDIAAEQRRLNELLSATQDNAVLDERKRFFSSPLSAAAVTKAETARRMVSTLPPPARPPKPQAADADRNTPTGNKRPPAPAASADDEDDELTTFRPESAPKKPVAGLNVPLPAALKVPPPAAALRVPPPPAAALKATAPAITSAPSIAAATAVGSAFTDEDEPTTFRAEPATINDLVTARPKAPSSDEEVTTFQPNLGELVSSMTPTGKEPRPYRPRAAEHNFEDESTSFFDAQHRSSTLRGQAPATPPAPPPNFNFEEEATHIFFNAEEGIDLPAPMPPPKAASATESGPQLPGKPARAQPPSGAHSRKTPLATAIPNGQVWLGAGAIVERGPTLEFAAPRRNERGPLLWLGLAMLVLTLIGLIVKTPLGIALGLRAPTEGAIEVRTVPPIAAAVKLDGIYRGRAPLRLEGVRTGDRMVALEADGFVTVARHVVVEGGGTASININLERQTEANSAQ